MIKFITTYLEKRAKAKQDQIAKAKANFEKRKANWIKEVKALRLITIKNVSYIKSSINTIKGIVNHAKGSNAAETKRKREFLRNKLAWFKIKLSEEEGMIIHYNSLLKRFKLNH